MSIYTILGGLSGDAFWTAYHTELTPYEQSAAQGVLFYDAIYCGWSPGPDTWIAPVSVAPPPVVYTPPPVTYVPPPIYTPPDTIPIVYVPTPPYVPPVNTVPAPELSTWIMLAIGFVLLARRSWRPTRAKALA